ncbi:MAG: hypothetical protein WCH62_02110, partial [Candidatus Omnitrophota bacterium]
ELCRRGMEIVAKGKTYTSIATPQKTIRSPQQAPVVVSAKKLTKVQKDLLGNSEVIQEIDKYKWCESEKAGHDVGFEWASQEWLKLHAEQWIKDHSNIIKGS